MARYSEYDITSVYSLSEQFLNRCLLKDGSLFEDESSLWTLENLKALHDPFVRDTDTSKRSFLEKFEDQIKPKDSDTRVTRLGAEVLAVYLLFPSNVGEYRKRELLTQVLGWAGIAFPNQELITQALRYGVGSGGQGYNTRRPFEMAFLIEFAIAWKSLPSDKQQAAIQDPWIFKEVLDEVEYADSRQMRHILLHLFFPDTFERIASSAHKRRIVAAFKPVLQDEAPDDIDRCIFAIRKRLEVLLNDKELDFYWSPLIEVWNDSGEMEDGIGSLEALHHKKQIVLYGPPGTGKTFTAERIAKQLIRTALLTKLGPNAYFQQAQSGQIDEEITSRIHQLQLHPNYGYEDFVRGLHIAAGGKTEYRLGYLPTLIQKINDDSSDLPHVLILDELNRTDLSRMLGECFSLLENRGKRIDLSGRDATDKQMTLSIPKNLFIIGTMNLIDQSIEQMDFALRRRFLWVWRGYNKDDLYSASRDRWGNVHRIEWSKVEDDFKKLANAAEELNRQIHANELLGPQYEVGHAYLLDTVAFLQADLAASRRPQNFLWDRQGFAKLPVRQTWELALKPLIMEYLSGLDSKRRDQTLNSLAEAFLKVRPELEVD